MNQTEAFANLKPDDDLGALFTISEQIDALGYTDIRYWLLEELSEDVDDISDGLLGIRSLRFVLRTLKLKHFHESVRSTQDESEICRNGAHIRQATR